MEDEGMITQGVNAFAEFETKMRAAKLSEAAIRAFKNSYLSTVAGKTGLIPENTITPVTNLPHLRDFSQTTNSSAHFSETVVLKLNGGLGTSMGLEKAKSLLQIKGALTFLDLIARQILFLRQKYSPGLRFMLMNSFSTSKDTLDFLRRYSEFGDPKSFELMQNSVPKVDAASLRPVSWAQNPELEWCPPGHGDLYPSLLGSGWLDRLLGQGVKFMFVSNSDNLGATLDPALLSYFADSKKPFLMEVAERTGADKKGGHLALANGRFLLRESAQCPEQDLAAFQDIERHRFFNTNNLWIRLDALRDLLSQNEGFVPLPLIKNAKTVDPRDKKSPAVFQLETAMGAAIECFDNSGAIIVPRDRFAPVKTTSDLLAVRSDAYEITEDFRLILARHFNGNPPAINLDGNHYKLVDQLDEKLREGVPSLVDCEELTVRGPILFNSRNIFHGKVSLKNPAPESRPLSAGDYPPGEYEV